MSGCFIIYKSFVYQFSYRFSSQVRCITEKEVCKEDCKVRYSKILGAGMHKTRFAFAANCPRAFRNNSTTNNHASNKHRYHLSSLLESYCHFHFGTPVSVCQHPPDDTICNSLIASSKESSHLQQSLSVGIYFSHFKIRLFVLL